MIERATVNDAPPSEAEYGRLRRYALSLTRDPAEADDLTQEVYLRAHASPAQLRDPDARMTWLYRIATRAHVDSVRRRDRRPVPAGIDVGDLPLADPGVSLAHAVERREMSACVQDFLARLPESYRAVLMLHDLEGLTVPEIAELLGLTIASVKIRLHRARTRLRAALDAGCALARDDQDVLVCEPRA